VLKKLHEEPASPKNSTGQLKPGLTLAGIPPLKSNNSIQALLRQCCKELDFEQATLFALDPAHRVTSVLAHAGDSIFNREAIPGLIYSPVRDVAEDREYLLINEITEREEKRFAYLLELCPTLVSTIAVPIQTQLQLDYALFVMDKDPRQISREQEIYVDAVGLAIGAILEQAHFKEQSNLIQRTALIGHLTRAMVHEINNLIGPLSARLENLQSNLARLEKNPVPEQQQERRNQLIGNELVEIQKNFKKLINTSRMFRRVVAKDKNEILRVDEIIKETIELLINGSDHNHIRIIFNPPDEWLVLRSAAAALEQILLNVMLNAVQQIAELRPETGGWVQVRVESRCESKKGGFLRILIEDNGPGIHASLWGKIFEVGYTTRGEGSGIGLYISKNLIEEKGGKIYVKESRILGGTTFALEIPCQL